MVLSGCAWIISSYWYFHWCVCLFFQLTKELFMGLIYHLLQIFFLVGYLLSTYGGFCHREALISCSQICQPFIICALGGGDTFAICSPLQAHITYFSSITFMVLISTLKHLIHLKDIFMLALPLNAFWDRSLTCPILSLSIILIPLNDQFFHYWLVDASLSYNTFLYS